MSERKYDLVPNGDSSFNQLAWFKAVESKIPTLQLFPHCKLGDGFAQYAMGSDTGCILICPIDRGTDVDEAAISLEKAKACLVRDEPCSEQMMALILNPERQIDTSVYKKRNIKCLTEREFVKFALDFFSESQEQIRLGKAAYYQGHFKIAFSLLVNANVDNDADAQYMIGQMYAKGKGIVKDGKLADQWHWKAAQQGHASAAIEVEKSLNRETKNLERQERELIDEIEEFTRKLLNEDE